MTLTRRAAVAGGLALASRGARAQAVFRACANRTGVAATLEHAPPGSWPCSRVHYLMAGPTPVVRLVYVNWYVAQGKERVPAGPMQVRAAVELAGKAVPCSFAGSPEVTVPPGGDVTSDPLAGPFAAGSILCVRTALTSADGSWPANVGLAGGGSQDGYLLGDGPAALLREIPDATRTVPGYGPAAMLGQVPLAGACAIVGDSGAAGAGDHSGDSHQDRGFIARALAGAVGAINVARSGELAAEFAAGAPRRIALLRAAGCDRAVILYGSNDIAARHDADRVMASLRAVWQALADAGVRQIVQCTILPKTDPGSGRALPGFEAHRSARAAVNAWLRTRPAPLAAIADAAELVEADGQWLTPDGRRLSDDGAHPNALGAALIAGRIGLAALLS